MLPYPPRHTTIARRRPDGKPGVGTTQQRSPGSRLWLAGFTLTSSNDSPPRDPQVWRIEGSNDTTNGLDGTWTTVYSRATASGDWSARNQFIRYSAADGDIFLTSQPFDAFRMVTAQTGATSGAFFALSTIELFGNVVIPKPAALSLLALGGLALLRRRKRS